MPALEETSIHAKNWVPVGQQPAYTPRRLRIVCVGAGLSGLTLAHQVKYNKDFEGFIDLVIYDKNHDVGGTWLENNYPGVACDIPAHLYTFPFEPNPDWSTFYASGSEILAYIKSTVKKYHLDENVQLLSRVTEATWDDETGKWNLKVFQKGQEIVDECDIFINGAGFLNKWQWPDIDGLHDFKGQLAHTANWDTSIDFADKRVAVIGNGSSAIQAVPSMQKTAASVTSFIRSPTWISTNFGAEFTKDGNNFTFTEDEKKKFREDPAFFNEFRKKLEHSNNKFFEVFSRDSASQQAARSSTLKTMQDRLQNDPELCDKLIPSFDLGCRRLTPGEGYLEALRAPNSRVIFDPIIKFTGTGIQTTREHTEFDIIVCATGFDVSFRPPWKMHGRNGCQLNLEWRDSPVAYFGVAAADNPNYFIFNGPNSPIGYGTLTETILVVTKWILRWCRKIASEDILSICVKREAVDDLDVYSQEYLKGTVWSAGCRSWYKNGKFSGRVTGVYAGSTLQLREILSDFRTEDFDIRYASANRFRFMGNGFTLREVRGEDLAFYVGK